MSIGELGAKVLVQYRADTSDIKSKLRELTGEEKKLAEQQLKTAEAHNKGLENQIKGLQRVQIGLELVQLSGVNLGGIFKDITGLSGGFISAGFAAGGAWGAAFGAAIEIGQKLGGVLNDLTDSALRRQIRDSEAYIAKIRDLEELDRLESQFTEGIRKQREAEAALDPTIGGVNRALGEHFTRLQEAKDAVVSYTLALQQVQADRGLSKLIDRQEIELERSTRDARARLDVLSKGYAPAVADVVVKATQQRDAIADVRKAHADGIITGKQYTDMLRALGVQMDNVQRLQMNPDNGARNVAIGRSEFTPNVGFGAVDPNVPSLGLAAEANRAALAQAGQDILRGLQVGADQRRRDGNESKLASMFGPLEEFDAYRTAFDTLAGATSAALGAWIDGSASAGAAFKKFVGESVKSLSIQMAVEALKHGAYALGALAFGDAKGASMHGIAALKFAGGAAAAAVAAKTLGTGGGATPGVGGGASGGGASGGGPQAGPSGSAPVIVYGDSFADDSPRNRQARAARIVNRVVGTTGVVYG